MATVTVFTAARMQEIEDNAIVDGEIDSSGHLILETNDGTPIDAGPVVSAAGTPFVGQYTTAGRPAATGLDGKIYWDTDEESFYLSNGSTWAELTISIDEEGFVGQYTTAGEPDATAMNNKIYWNTDDETFYLSNGTTWSALDLGISEPYVGQYATVDLPSAVANPDKLVWDMTVEAFYKSDGAAWVAVSRELLAGENIDLDDSVPGYTTVNLVEDISVNNVTATGDGSFDEINARIAALGRAHTATANRQMEISGVSPGIDHYATGAVPASPVATVSGTVLARWAGHGYRDDLAVTTSDNRFEVVAAETFTPTAQGERFRWLTKAIGTTAAVESMSLEDTGSLILKRPLGGLGYGTGAGSAVTQGTSRTTAVTIDTICGRITLFTTTMTTGLIQSFTVNNSTVVGTDVVVCCIAGFGSTPGYYRCWVDEVATGSFIMNVQNVNASTSPSEAVVINFAILRSVNA